MKNLNLRDMFGIILILLVCFLTYTVMKQGELIKYSNDEQKSLKNEMKVLGDGLSIKSGVTELKEPKWFDKLLNTKTNKEFKEFQNMIPEIIRNELKDLKIENKVTEVNKTTLLLEGDSVVYQNKDGVVTKYGKVVPLNGDSSLLVLIPQEIEITNVRTDDKDGSQLFITAFNKTTGDTLRVKYSNTIRVNKDLTGFKFKPTFKASVGYGLQKEIMFRSELGLIKYQGKKFKADFLSPAVGNAFGKVYGEIIFVSLEL